MKKLLGLMLSAVMLVSCSTDEIGNDSSSNDERSTHVYAMGKQMNVTDQVVGTRAGVEANWADAYYFIRIDGRIPKNVGVYQAKEYWPYNGGSVFKPENKGLVDISYPYWKIFSDNSKSSIREYVYDSTGKEVEKVIDKVPSFTSMMSVNKKDVEDIAAIDTTNLKIIWYVAKYTYNKWHVDGVLTFKEVENVEDIPGGDYGEPNLENKADEPVIEGLKNIEVDIHQQEHKDWQEIKTSVHVRDLVDKITIEIPLEYENIAEVDDFAIRTYDLEIGSTVYINGTEYALDSANPVKVTIEHKADKIIYTIVCKDAKYLAALQKEYKDGATIEIHTYPKNITNEAVWEKLKKTTVKVAPENYENLVFKGATSAFYAE